MKFYKLNSPYKANVNISKYIVQWDRACRSQFQFNVKKWLQPYWQGHVCLEELLIPGSRLTCDFVNLTLGIVVEISGEQHNKYVEFFHLKNRENFLLQISNDLAKKAWTEANNMRFVEIFDCDLPLTKAFFSDKYGIYL